MKCERCGHEDALRYVIALSNDDPESYEEGTAVADVQVYLCSECETAVADELLEFKARVVSQV